MTDSITRQQFISDLSGQSATVADLESGPDRLVAARADLDGDGTIAGRDELHALFDTLDRRDDTQTNAVRVSQGGTRTALGRQIDALRPKFTPVSATAARPTRLSDGERMAQGGSHSMNDASEAHWEGVDTTGIGTRYGPQSNYASMTATQRQQWIENNRLPGTNPEAPERCACITWAMEHLEQAYIRAGRFEQWNQIRARVVADDLRGTTLAQALQDDGWEAVYFNPDVNDRTRGDEHPFTAALAAQGRAYYGVVPDHQIINYGRATNPDTTGLDALDDVPFFFGVAHGGTHTFVGGQGTVVGRRAVVNEYHWDGEPNERDAIEERTLSDFSTQWRSGILMVPPDTWPDP